MRSASRRCRRRGRWVAALALAAASLLPPAPIAAYPTDPAAQEQTRIRRLRWQQDINEGKRRGRALPPGALWPMSAIRLRMRDNPGFDVASDAPRDAALQAGLEAIVARRKWRRYNLALLDISDPARPRYAAINPDQEQTPGSTAKVLLAAGLLRELRARFGDDVQRRMETLRNVQVPADDWLMPNHHEVPVITGDIYGGADYQSAIRSVRRGDTFSLWEWMDHALSPSSNASASMIWREATLMRLLGEAYPPPAWDAELFARWDRDALSQAAFDVVDQPMLDAGLGTEDFYIRMFFTRGASKYVKSEASRGTPRGILQWMLRMEQGRLVDPWSSLELKRMLYLTRRRIRYALSPALDTSATFFKTGSLYQCVPEEGYQCGAYRGNAVNVLNAMIVVETPPDPPPPEPPPPELAPGTQPAPAAAPAPAPAPGLAPATEAAPTAQTPAPPPEPRWVYLVAVMSNELKRNAAEDHALLATEIHALVTGKVQP